MKRFIFLLFLLPMAAQANFGSTETQPRVSKKLQDIMRVLGEVRGEPLSSQEIKDIVKNYDASLRSTRVASNENPQEDVHVLVCAGAGAGLAVGIGVDLNYYICAEWGHLYLAGMTGASGLAATASLQAGTIIVRGHPGDDITGDYYGGRVGAALKFGASGALLIKDMKTDDKTFSKDDLDKTRSMFLAMGEFGFGGEIMEMFGGIRHMQVNFVIW